MTLLPLMALLGIPSPAQAISIKLKDVAPDRIERQRKAALGELPLPGTPAIDEREERLEAKGMVAGSPVVIRIFKEDSELELWMMKDGRFEHFASLSHLPLVRHARPETRRRRQAGTRRLLHRHPPPDASSRALAALA